VRTQIKGSFNTAGEAVRSILAVDTATLQYILDVPDTVRALILDTIKTYSAVDPAARIYIDLEVSFPNNHWGEDRARASISGIIDIDRTPLPAPMPVPDVQQAIARTEQIARDMGLGDLLDGKAAERPPEEWPTEQVVPEVKTDA
jgi:hypothetical protein